MIQKDYSDYCVNEPSRPREGVATSAKGFTIQVEDIIRREKILQIIIEQFREFKLNPEDSGKYLSDSHQDLIEIILNQKFSVGEAWQKAYKLRRLPGVIYAEPRFAILGPLGPRNSCCTQSTIIEVRLAAAKHPEWSLHQMRVHWVPELAQEHEQPEDAWETFFTLAGKTPGEGVKIGHPDTGYLRHPELDEETFANQRFRKGKAVSDGESETELSTGELAKLPANFWHGTSTASVIISPVGSPTDQSAKVQDAQSPEKYVTGVAPGAELVAIPIMPLVVDDPRVKIYTPSLAQAIDEAVEKEGVHVLSISLGGYPSLAVRRAIINAYKKGVIIVASAGNTVPFTIWPAAYDRVIAVASSTADRKLAKHSAEGSRVDVAAPGEGVWAAVAKFVDGRLTYAVEQCSGTSYAAALVAGVAALWLSRWGREYLKDCYGGYDQIPLVFDKLLRSTCDPSNEVAPNRSFGIVNAYKLLAAETTHPDGRAIPLSMDDPVLQAPPAFAEVDHVALDQGGLATFTHLFEKTLTELSFVQAIGRQVVSSAQFAQEAQLDVMQWVFSKLFNQSRKDLRDSLRTFGKELTFHFGTNFHLYKMMEKAIQAAAKTKADPATAEPSFQDALDQVRQELKEKHASAYLRAYLP